MEVTTTEYTTRSGSTLRVYRYDDQGASFCMTRGSLDASVFVWPDKDTSGVVQDERLDETDNAAYTGYEKEDLKRVLLARVLNQPLQGADDVMADCFLAFLSVDAHEKIAQS